MADILADDIFERNLLNENIWFSINISLNFVPKDQINTRRQAIIWTDADPIHWRIYAALGGDELKLRRSDDRLRLIVELPKQII